MNLSISTTRFQHTLNGADRINRIKSVECFLNGIIPQRASFNEEAHVAAFILKSLTCTHHIHSISIGAFYTHFLTDCLINFVSAISLQKQLPLSIIATCTTVRDPHVLGTKHIASLRGYCRLHPKLRTFAQLTLSHYLRYHLCESTLPNFKTGCIRNHFKHG